MKDKNIKKPEILSPAGNFDKMRSAILYGADAVYLAGEIFGMRAAADNFSLTEMAEAVEYAHARGVKVYLTLNTMPREYEYSLLRKYLEDLSHINIDAMIIADVGVLALVKEVLPNMEIHISTQANATSAAACRAWHALGAKRVVLARELTLDEIKARKYGRVIPKGKKIREAFRLFFEVFIKKVCILSLPLKVFEVLRRHSCECLRTDRDFN